MRKLEGLASLLRYATRSLVRRPTLSAVALVTLALGIGANTAIFSVVNSVLLKPLPFENAGRLVMVWSTAPTQGVSEGFASYPDFKDWQEQSKAFERLATLWTFPNGDVNLTGGAEPQRVSVARISTGFFEVLGVRPLYGRTFTAEESIVGNHRRAILSYGLWAREFGSDSTLVGRTVMVNGFPYNVVGIMPPELQTRSVRVLGTDVDLWRPLVPEDGQTGGRNSRKLRVVGRLAAGTTIPRAEAEVNAIANRLEEMYPASNRDAGARLVPLREQVVRDVRRGLLFLSAAVGIVLLGACVNVANLLLIKAAGDKTQRAVQHALGASRLRLSAHVLAESLVLGVAGAVLGIMLAFAIVKVVVALGPADIPLLADARIDGAVLVFTIGATLLTASLAGLLPAWRSARPEISAVLRQAASRSRGRSDRRVMRLLTVTQIAIAMMLLTAGGLMIRSFQALLRVNPGLDTSNVLTFNLELPMGSGMPYSSQATRDVFFATLLERAKALPGVQAATMANAPPLEEEPSAFTFRRVGVDGDRDVRANFRMAGPAYFAVLGIPITNGRSFTNSDGRSAPPVAIVSETVARTVWRGANPVGTQIVLPNGDQAEVVGVAGDVRTTGLDGDQARTLYVPATQGGYNFMAVVLKTVGHPDGVAPAARRLVHEMDSALPLHRVRTLDQLLRQSVAQQRFQMLIVTSLSALVFALAVVGTYGVASYGVSERTGELAIRMALGATAADIRRLLIGDGVRIALVGIAIGAVAAAALSRLLTRFLFQVGALDIVTFTAAPALLGTATLLATFLPARRATRVDPMHVIRAQ
jgi:putative ABC transport system permease protein